MDGGPNIEDGSHAACIIEGTAAEENKKSQTWTDNTYTGRKGCCWDNYYGNLILCVSTWEREKGGGEEVKGGWEEWDRKQILLPHLEYVYIPIEYDNF